MQASLKIVLSELFPKKKFSFTYLDRVTHHKKGRWTWEGSGLLWLASKHVSVVTVGDFDYRKFAKEGKKYLKNIYKEKGRFEIEDKMADLDFEQKVAQKLIRDKRVMLVNKKVTLKDLKEYLDNGYYIMASINPLKLTGEKGHVGHTVVVLSIDDIVTFHDAGLPAKAYCEVDKKLFSKALNDFIAVRNR